jgi:hypothetical protein
MEKKRKRKEKKKEKKEETKTKEKKGEFRAGLYSPGIESRNTTTHAMNTASKLGPHTQTDRGTCPGVGL